MWDNFVELILLLSPLRPMHRWERRVMLRSSGYSSEGVQCIQMEAFHGVLTVDV